MPLMNLSLSPLPCSMSVSCFSQSPSSGEVSLVLLEHRDHLKALRGRLQVLACALDVLATDQRLDRLGARGRGAEAAPSSPRAAPRRRSACRRSPSRRGAWPPCNAAAASSPSPRSRRQRPSQLPLLELRQLGALGILSFALASAWRPYTARHPASSVTLPRVRKRSSSTRVTIVVRA